MFLSPAVFRNRLGDVSGIRGLIGRGENMGWEVRNGQGQGDRDLCVVPVGTAAELLLWTCHWAGSATESLA